MSKTKREIKQYTIPYHHRDKLQIFNEIHQKRNNLHGHGAIPGNYFMIARSNLKELSMVLEPDKKDFRLSSKERKKIEKVTQKMVQNGYRSKPDLYPVPEWIREKTDRKEYYIARLKYEIELRLGYKCAN